VISLPVELPYVKHRWDEHDFGKTLYQAQFSPAAGWHFRPFPDKLLREDLLRNRQLAVERGHHLRTLEVFCRDHLARSAEYMPEHLSAFLGEELRGCDPAHGVFTRSIEEYADVAGIDPAAAYQELRLKLRSNGLVAMRTYAQHQKFMMKMNACDNEEDFLKVFGQFMDAMYTGAAV
jgi:hypothetical protein